MSLNFDQKHNPELVIKPFDNQLAGSDAIHPDLPQPPFTIMLCCPKGGGKSTNIIRLIYGNRKCKSAPKKSTYHKFYRHYFSRIFVFSPTWRLDKGKTGRCNIPDDQVFDEQAQYEEVLQEIVDAQIEDIEEDGQAEPVLIIFSDLAGSSLFTTRKNSVVNRLAFNSRHLNISLIVDTQSLRQISNPFRENLSAILLFGGISNRLELRKIYEEYLGTYTEKQAQEILNYVFKDSMFNFLAINFQKGGQMSKNWDPFTVSEITLKTLPPGADTAKT